MRTALVPILLCSLLACGSSKLSRREAESDIRKDYPVQVVVQIPEKARAATGSPEATKLAALQEGLTKTGWFTVEHRTEGGQEVYAFKANASTPKTLKLAAQGWELPAAQAVFVRATDLQPSGSSARVTYQVRLSNPTPHFALFQALHPDVKIGDTKSRHAIYQKDGRAWVLQETDEKLKKAE